MTYWDVEERGGIAVAKHNNPPMNYFVAGRCGRAAELLRALARPDVRVVVITGAPRASTSPTTASRSSSIGDDPERAASALTT